MQIELKSYLKENECELERLLLEDTKNYAFFRRLLDDMTEDSRVIFCEEKAVGLVFSERNGTARYCVIYVEPRLRRKGIGSAVLSIVERELPPETNTLSSFFIMREPSTAAFAKKHGFQRSFDSAYMEYRGEKKKVGELPVRQYRDEDYREAQKMYAEAFHRMRVQVGDFPNSVPAPQSEAGRKAWLNDAENYLLYEEDGEIVGVGHLYEEEIGSVSVRIDRQGKGIGRGFVMYLMNCILERGHDRVCLECVVGNPARKLYDSLGFKELYTQRFVNKKMK